MDKKATSVFAYFFSWVGLLIAFLATNDKEGAKFHLNQALVIKLAALLCIVPTILGLFFAFIPYIGFLITLSLNFLGFAWGVFVIVCWVMGLIYASKQQEKEVPLIGKIHILK